MDACSSESLAEASSWAFSVREGGLVSFVEGLVASAATRRSLSSWYFRRDSKGRMPFSR